MRYRTINFKTLYFSTDGRVNRARFWLGSLPFIGLLVLGLLLDNADVANGSLRPFGFYTFAGLIYFVPGLALSVKRCHDRDHSGWFILLNLVPLLSLWYAVEIGFLTGTPGPNRFGHDPLGPEKGHSEDKEDSRTWAVIAELTDPTESIVVAGAKLTTSDSALAVFAQCALDSLTIAKVPVGTVVQLGPVVEIDGREWTEVLLPDGLSGFSLLASIRSHCLIERR